jgi:hypothetical protein
MDDETPFQRYQEMKIAVLGAAIVVLYVLDWLGIFSSGVKQVMDLVFTDPFGLFALIVLAFIFAVMYLRSQQK